MTQEHNVPTPEPDRSIWDKGAFEMERIKIPRCSTAHLAMRGNIGDSNRTAASQSLERRKAESFIDRRIHKSSGAGIQGR